jgi:hypothetical protein
MITRQIKVLLSSYRRDDYADPDGFVAQVGVIMERYPERVILAATEPTYSRSIQRRYQFPPNIKEVADALEEEAVEQHRLAAAARQPKPISNWAYVPPRNDPGCRANLFVGEDLPQYAAVMEWARGPLAEAQDWQIGSRDGKAGLWISLGVWETFSKRVPRSWKSPSEAEIRASLGRIAAAQARLQEREEAAT